MPAEHVWKRVEGVREALGKSDAEALVLFVFEGANWESMYYLTGFRGTSSAAVVTKKDAFLITDGRYLSQAQLQSPFTIVPQGQRHIHETVGEVLSGAGVTQAGFEGERISFAFHKKLSDMPVRWHDLSEVLPKLRRCKDLLERQFVEKAASIAAGWRPFWIAIRSTRVSDRKRSIHWTTSRTIVSRLPIACRHARWRNMSVRSTSSDPTRCSGA